MPRTPTREGITFVSPAKATTTGGMGKTARTSGKQSMRKTAEVIGKRSPSNRRDPLPLIVKVATGVTSRIVEPSTFTEAEMDSIMNVPSYIYFEEHHCLESYKFTRAANPRFVGFRPFFSNADPKNSLSYPAEEVKDELDGCAGIKRPYSFQNKIMQVSNQDGFSSDQENVNPNSQCMIVTTGGWKKRKSKKASEKNSMSSTSRSMFGKASLLANQKQ